jgi:hypothetical protein
MAIDRTILLEEVYPDYFRTENEQAPEQIHAPSRKALKGDSEITKTDRNYERRMKKKRQSTYYANREKNLKRAAFVKGDVRAQVKLDKASAEKRLKAFKNVKVLTSKKPGVKKHKNNLKNHK